MTQGHVSAGTRQCHTIATRGFPFRAVPHLCLAPHNARRRRLPQPQRLLQAARGQHARVQCPPLLATLPQEAAET